MTRVGAGPTGPGTDRRLVSLDRWVQLPDPPLMTGYANWHSGEVESLVPVGSSPTSVTDRNTIPWSNGEDAWVTTRKVLVRFQPGITDAKWSVGVLAAHLRGKEEDPVQLRDGPLIRWAGMFPGGD